MKPRCVRNRTGPGSKLIAFCHHLDIDYPCLSNMD